MTPTIDVELEGVLVHVDNTPGLTVGIRGLHTQIRALYLVPGPVFKTMRKNEKGASFDIGVEAGKLRKGIAPHVAIECDDDDASSLLWNAEAVALIGGQDFWQAFSDGNAVSLVSQCEIDDTGELEDAVRLVARLAAFVVRPNLLPSIAEGIPEAQYFPATGAWKERSKARVEMATKDGPILIALTCKAAQLAVRLTMDAGTKRPAFAASYVDGRAAGEAPGLPDDAQAHATKIGTATLTWDGETLTLVLLEEELDLSERITAGAALLGAIAREGSGGGAFR